MTRLQSGRLEGREFDLGQEHYLCFLHRVQTGCGVHTTLIQGATRAITMQIKRSKLEAYHLPSTFGVGVRSYAVTPSGRQAQQFHLYYYYY